MGWDYALVHVKYNIPPAIALAFLYRPLLVSTDVYKLVFLITIAVISTIPWDSYLIRHGVWTYPDDAVIGWTLLDIPAEELFFFVIQTFNTTLLYLILSKPTFHPVYLKAEGNKSFKQHGLSTKIKGRVGQLFFAIVLHAGYSMLKAGGQSFYMGLIVSWAGPFMLLLWSLAYQFLLELPFTNTLVPIFLPTLYLWLVDTFSLKRGTWVIEADTKLGLYLWDSLELEEAVFFLVTNTMIVFGLVAFDNALAVLYSFPHLFPESTTLPSPVSLVQALLTPTNDYNPYRIRVLDDAVQRLQRKSRSFFLASATFQGRLRIDLILLYSYCRVADDLIDDAMSPDEAKLWVEKLQKFLDLSYSKDNKGTVGSYVKSEFPANLQMALLHLPTPYLSKKPLDDLLKGFEMDLQFSTKDSTKATPQPIKMESDLETYGSRVAGTVAELVLDLVFYHHASQKTSAQQVRLKQSGHRMGIALQFVNIARDIAVDAEMGRVYLPTTWLDEHDLTVPSVLKNPRGTRIGRLRSRLLDRGFQIYREEINTIEQLPKEARGPMRTAVESYMEIGEVLRQEGYEVKRGKATVPKLRRIEIAWKAMSGTLSRTTKKL